MSTSRVITDDGCCNMSSIVMSRGVIGARVTTSRATSSVGPSPPRRRASIVTPPRIIWRRAMPSMALASAATLCVSRATRAALSETADDAHRSRALAAPPHRDARARAMHGYLSAYRITCTNFSILGHATRMSAVHYIVPGTEYAYACRTGLAVLWA